MQNINVRLFTNVCFCW